MTKSLPPIEGIADWRGPDIVGPGVAATGKTVRTLSDAQVAEIDAALRHLRARGDIDFPDIAAEAFPLPTLGEFFTSLARELKEGPGFLLLRGLPIERYSPDDLARIYFGIGLHIGTPILQSHHGELIGHVLDVSDIEPDARGYHAGGAQGMHTDNCDIVSLLCRRGAKSGGLSRIVSATAVHNELWATQPDLLEELYRAYPFRRMERDAQQGSGVVTKEIPIFSQASGSLSCMMNGSYIRRAIAAGEAVLSSQQSEALAAFRRIASSPDFYFDMEIGEGDIQFLNNRAILHGRTGYEDCPEIEKRRHMMRLWLKVPAWPDLPDRQGVHTSADHPGWSRQRKRLMELPSRYFAEIIERKGATAPASN